MYFFMLHIAKNVYKSSKFLLFLLTVFPTSFISLNHSNLSTVFSDSPHRLTSITNIMIKRVPLVSCFQSQKSSLTSRLILFVSSRVWNRNEKYWYIYWNLLKILNPEPYRNPFLIYLGTQTETGINVCCKIFFLCQLSLFY